MSKFTTRVELYGNPSYETYKKLHEAMEKAGFVRTIVFDKIKYWLPNAEYNSEGTMETSQVLQSAKTAATTVWPVKEFGVLVTRTEVTREMHNLKSVQ
jgi:hypothetical protein